MKNLFLTICAFAVLALCSINVNAQIRTPAPSPGSKVTQTVGLTDVTIEYSRPGAKGRTVFSKDGVVPFGSTWRVGANAATKFTFSDDVRLGDSDLKAGSYAVLAMPGADDWKIMLYNYDGTNWQSYTEKTPVATVMAKPMKMNDMVETFTIDVNNIKNNSATIDLIWEKTMVSLPLEVPTDKMVMASIERTMAGPTANDYAAAAGYYLSAKKDLNMALDWIKKANADNPRYFNLRTESLILAELGKKDDAIKAAEKSLALAKEAKDDAYVRMNEKSIAEWKKMK